jgi:hypothetical protein
MSKFVTRAFTVLCRISYDSHKDSIPLVFYSDHGSFVTYAACIYREFRICFFAALQLTVFNLVVFKCQPPAFKQAPHILEVFLDI